MDIDLSSVEKSKMGILFAAAEYTFLGKYRCRVLGCSVASVVFYTP